MNINKNNISNSVSTILSSLGEDITREGLLKTPERVAKSFEFLTKGYKENPEKLIQEALFEAKNQEMILVKDIEFYSLCEHHILPFFGTVSLAYIPDIKIVGLSKIARIIDIFSRRLQIQERLTEEIANSLFTALKAKGVAVIIEARHMCMEMRGVQKNNSRTVTQFFNGIFNKEEKYIDKFYSLVK